MSNRKAEESLNKLYNYVVGIDIGTYSTSFSYVHVDYKDDIQTITDWKQTNKKDFGGRVASSMIYKQKDSVPLWGGLTHKRFYNENTMFFHTSNIKLYLTDADNQIDLPKPLTPVKLVSDYLKQIHEYGVNQMKTYFQKINEKNKVEKLEVADHKLSSNEKSNEHIFNVTEDQIRYIFSYPDNEVDGVYRVQMKDALEMAGIINRDDPDHRLTFITESEATAHFCMNQYNLQLKPSPEPYLVCYVGGKAVGFSTIQVEEVFEAATIISHVDQAIVGSGSLDVDKNMEKYLADKITASPEDDALLDRTLHELFDFYIDEIKPTFTEESYGTDYYYKDILEISNSTIKSTLFDGDYFVFTCDDMKSKIFDPVTNNILENIENVIKKLNMGISGIILSSDIGERGYLKSLVKNKFDTTTAKVISIEDNGRTVSEGLIYSGIRRRGLMAPYFERREVKQKQKQRVLSVGDESYEPISTSFGGVKKINHKDIDYIIGLDFGSTYSGFAYAPVPKNEDEEKKSHTLVIKEIRSWPEQNGGSYPKIPSMLYYNQKMEYQNKFGYEARNESVKSKSGGVLLSHFKCLLSRYFDPKVDNKALENLDDNAIVDAVANFLKDFNKEGITRMERAGAEVNKDRLGYILTIPAIWSDEVKNTMRAAVKRAELVKSIDLDERVRFITEAEAAALYCERYGQDVIAVERQQRFMICDAGGATVNLTTFEVAEEEEEEEEEEEVYGKLLFELTSGESYNCGSVSLDDEFLCYILNEFDKNGIPFNEKAIEIILDQFIREIKPNFEPSWDPELEDDIRFDIPMSLDIPTKFKEDRGFIQDSQIVIPYSEMENEVFKPVVNQVLRLIYKQLRKLPEGERQLDSILVVGGFGQSIYLRQKITDKFENKAVGAGFISKPSNGDLAVCRGAVSFGLEPRMVAETITRYTFGLQVKDLCRKGDDPQQKIFGYDDIYCQNVFSEIVLKDTVFKMDSTYTIKTFVIYPNNPIFVIYSTDKTYTDTDLRRIITTGDIQHFCTLTSKMPDIPEIMEGDKVEFYIQFKIEGASINIGVFNEGKSLAEKTVTMPSLFVLKNKYKRVTKYEERKRRKEKWRFKTKVQTWYKT